MGKINMNKKNPDKTSVRITISSGLDKFLDDLSKNMGISTGTLIALIIDSYMNKEWIEEEIVFFLDQESVDSLKTRISDCYEQNHKNKDGIELFRDKLSEQVRERYRLKKLNFQLSKKVYDNLLLIKEETGLSIPITTGLIQCLLLLFKEDFESKDDFDLKRMEAYYNTIQRVYGFTSHEMQKVTRLALLSIFTK